MSLNLNTCGCVLCLTLFVFVSPTVTDDRIEGRIAPAGDPSEQAAAVDATAAQPEPVDFAALPRAAREARARILTALAAEVSGEFVETPLNEVIASLAKATDTNMMIDTKALGEEGIAGDVPVSDRFEKIRLEQALRRILEPHALTWVVTNEVLEVTTPTNAENYLHTTVYPLKSLIDAGFSESRLIELVQNLTTGPWVDVQGSAGTLSGPQDALIVRQTEQMHAEISQLLAALQDAVNQKIKSHRILSLYENDEAILRQLSRKMSFEVQNTPLFEVAEHLQQQTSIPIRIDRKALEEEGISNAEPVTIRLHDLTLSSILNQVLKRWNCTYVVENGALVLTTHIAARLFTGVYNVSDLVQHIEHEALQETIMNETVGPWLNRDGDGGNSMIARHGVLVVQQTQQAHRFVAVLLDDLRRVTAQRALPPQEPADPAAVVMRVYSAKRVTIGPLAEAIPRFVAPDTWKNSGGAGEIQTIDFMLVVRQTAEVHAEIQKFLAALEAEAAKQQAEGGGGGFGGGGGGGFGGGGGGGSGGFFDVRSGRAGDEETIGR